jgi:hypothetical protein
VCQKGPKVKRLKKCLKIKGLKEPKSPKHMGKYVTGTYKKHKNKSQG